MKSIIILLHVESNILSMSQGVQIVSIESEQQDGIVLKWQIKKDLIYHIVKIILRVIVPLQCATSDISDN